MKFDSNVIGFIFQYPDTDGSIYAIEDVIQKAKSAQV
jgi:glycine cleavage system pyridoxal-binding protein P